MHIQLFTLLLTTLLTLATADRLTVDSNCSPRCTRWGLWYDDWGHVFNINAYDGCRRPGIPNINNVCYDWARKRGHFDATGQRKRCFRQVNEVRKQCEGEQGVCYFTTFEETACNWREAVPAGAVDGKEIEADVEVSAGMPNVTASAFRA